VRNANFSLSKIKISKSFTLSLVKIKDCLPRMKIYASYEDIWLSSVLEWDLFYFVEELAAVYKVKELE
jgi:hypothetical protein